MRKRNGARYEATPARRLLQRIEKVGRLDGIDGDPGLEFGLGLAIWLQAIQTDQNYLKLVNHLKAAERAQRPVSRLPVEPARRLPVDPERLLEVCIDARWATLQERAIRSLQPRRGLPRGRPQDGIFRQFQLEVDRLFGFQHRRFYPQLAQLAALVFPDKFRDGSMDWRSYYRALLRARKQTGRVRMRRRAASSPHR